MERARPAAILLAAGESTRMGRTKALLPWLGRPLVGYQIEQLIAAGFVTVVTVVGHQGDRVRAVVERIGDSIVADNPAYRTGKVSSILAGLRVLPSTVDPIALLAVDQPRTAQTLARLLSAHLEAQPLITLPVCAGRRGHPVILASALRDELGRITEDQQGLRAILRTSAGEILEVPVKDREVLLDLNTPEDYTVALRCADGSA